MKKEKEIRKRKRRGREKEGGREKKEGKGKGHIKYDFFDPALPHGNVLSILSRPSTNTEIHVFTYIKCKTSGCERIEYKLQLLKEY